LQDKLPTNTLVAVWDNNSCDNTIDIIKVKFPEIHIYRSKENVGFGRGVNGLREKTEEAKYIMVLNPDAELLKFDYHKLDNKQDDLSSVVIWGAKIIDQHGNTMPSTFAFSGALKEIIKMSEINHNLPSKWRPTLSKWAGWLLGGSFSAYADSITANPRKYDWVSGSAMIIRGDLFANDNLFDPGYFLYYEDGDLCKRARVAGYNVKQLSNFVIRHRTYGSSSYNSITRQKAEIQSMVYYRKKWSPLITLWIISIACLLKSLFILFGFSLTRNEDEIDLSRSYMMASKALMQ